MNPHLILAAGYDAETFFGGNLGGAIQALLVVVGIIVVLVSLFKGVPKFIEGKIGAGLRSVIGGLLVAAICFQPLLLTGVIELFGSLLGLATDEGDSLVNQGGGGGR